MRDTAWLFFALAAIPLFIGLYASLSFWTRVKDRRRSKHGVSIVADKARSWIITGAASVLVSVCSLPYVWDYVKSGFDLAAVERRPILSNFSAGVFIAYLACDIGVGLICYRSQISFATGYCHHVAYIVMLSYAATQGWLHLFAFAAIEELPTAILAAGLLMPKLRSDYLFASTFAITRLVFHVAMIAALITPIGRTVAYADGRSSIVPFTFFLPGLPLHIFWFHGCVRGIIRRRNKARKARAEKPVDISTVDPIVEVKAMVQEERTVRRRIVRGINKLRGRGGSMASTERRRFGSPLSPNVASPNSINDTLMMMKN